MFAASGSALSESYADYRALELSPFSKKIFDLIINASEFLGAEAKHFSITANAWALLPKKRKAVAH